MDPAELKSIMESLGDNQKKFAHRIGVSETAVSLWLQGKRTMHPIFAIHIRRLAKKKRAVA